MKLIIDIPEDVYTRLFDNGIPTDIADGIVMERAIRLGTPLEKHDTEVFDKIRAEIEQYQADCDFSCSDDSNCRTCNNITFGSIYRIIDKYRGEK